MFNTNRFLQTKLLPKSYFLDHLRREQSRANRSKMPLSIALFDFSDGNKGNSGKFIEQFHEFLYPLEKDIRETDVLGHVGKDVVGLLLPDTNEKGTQELIKKVINGHTALPFTISMGTYPDQIFQRFLTEKKVPPDSYPLFLDDFLQIGQKGYPLKRALDIVGALVALLVFSPIMLITALAIKITSPGPVIFKQLRLGQKGVPFVFYKFRSMRCDTDDRIHREYVTRLIQGKLEEINQGDQEQPLYKIKQDPRVTWVGRIIRKTSIDELPQLFNVLKGEMSLVGPRPPLPYEAEKYQSWHLRRILEAKPGITGIWQVEGRSKTSFDEMVRQDIRYIRHCSLWLDLKLLFKTVKVVLQCGGAV